MPIRCGEIKGFKLSEKFENDGYGNNIIVYRGFNDAIEKQGNVSLGLNREKLESIILDLEDNWRKYGNNKWEVIANAIILDENELIEKKG